MQVTLIQLKTNGNLKWLKKYQMLITDIFLENKLLNNRGEPFS